MALIESSSFCLCFPDSWACYCKNWIDWATECISIWFRWPASRSIPWLRSLADEKHVGTDPYWFKSIRKRKDTRLFPRGSEWGHQEVSCALMLRSTLTTIWINSLLLYSIEVNTCWAWLSMDALLESESRDDQPAQLKSIATGDHDCLQSSHKTFSHILRIMIVIDFQN